VISDTTLMFQVKAGDIDKMAILFERYHKILFGYFYKIIHDADVCNDLVQNVFYRMIKYRMQFMGKGEFSTWMFTIAHHVFIDNLKKNKKIDYLDEINQLHNKIPEEQNDIERLHAMEDIRLLQQALQQLDDKHREVLILSKYKQLKYNEIGTILNCSENNVKIRVFRALNELRRIYKKIENNGYEKK
jgi:RNA polymerase sigma factor (sigma-70 family)